MHPDDGKQITYNSMAAIAGLSMAAGSFAHGFAHAIAAIRAERNAERLEEIRVNAQATLDRLGILISGLFAEYQDLILCYQELVQVADEIGCETAQLRTIFNSHIRQRSKLDQQLKVNSVRQKEYLALLNQDHVGHPIFSALLSCVEQLRAQLLADIDNVERARGELRSLRKSEVELLPDYEHSSDE